MSVLSVLSNGDAMSSLMWATFLATILLLVLLIGQRVLTFRECIEVLKCLHRDPIYMMLYIGLVRRD